jgi:hypothetical protein
MKVGLDSTSGFSKFRKAREYRRAARDAYRFAKVTFAFDLSNGFLIPATACIGQRT